MIESPRDTEGLAAVHIRAIAEHGDRAAFTLLFARFAPRIKAFLIRRGTPEGAAEELAQEALLSVWRKAAYFDPARGTGEAWIFTIARNVAIDARRRDRALPAVAFDIDGLAEDIAPRGDAVTEANQSAERLREAMLTLPRDQIEVLRLSFFEDRAHGEIAEVLHLPLGTVKSRLRLAMKRLRSLVEDLA